MEYNVTDRGWYEEITLTAWGDTSGFDAVHAYGNDYMSAVILEPQDRTDGNWDEDDEERFRTDVRLFVQSWEEMPDTLVFDPARDVQDAETL